MAESNEELGIIVRLRDFASKQLVGVGRGIKRFAIRARAAFSAVKKAVFSLKTAFISLAALGFGAMAVKAAEFERQVLNITTLLGDQSVNVNRLKDDILALSRETGQSLQSLSKGLFDSISAGIKAAESLEFVAQAAKLATGGSTDVATAVDGLTTILNAFSLEAEDTTDVSDKLFVAMKFGKTTIAELSQSLGTVAPAARASGLKVEELVGSLSVMTKSGIKTAEAATFLRATLTALGKASKEQRDLAADLGIDLSLAGLKARGAAGFFADLARETGGSFDAMLKLFPEVRAATGALALGKDEGKEFAEVMRLMETRAGATEEAFQKVANSDAFKFEKAKKGFDAVIIKIGQDVLPAVTQFLNFVADNSRAVFLGIKNFSLAVFEFIKGTITAVLAILIGIVASLLKSITFVTGKVLNVVSSTVSKLGSILEKIPSRFLPFKEEIISTLSAVSDSIKNFNKTTIKSLDDTANEGFMSVKKLAIASKDAFVKGGGFIIESFVPSVETAIQKTNALKSVISETGDKLSTLGTTEEERKSPFFEKFKSETKSIADNFQQTLSNAFLATFQTGNNFIQNFGNAFKATIQSMAAQVLSKAAIFGLLTILSGGAAGGILGSAGKTIGFGKFVLGGFGAGGVPADTLGAGTKLIVNPRTGKVATMDEAGRRERIVPEGADAGGSGQFVANINFVGSLDRETVENMWDEHAQLFIEKLREKERSRFA